MLTCSQDLLQCLCVCAQQQIVGGRFSADRLPWSADLAPTTIMPLLFFFHERSLLPGFGHMNVNLKTLAVLLKNKPEPTPAASEYEASRMLRKALPIIQL